jgi:hypothetical protein
MDCVKANSIEIQMEYSDSYEFQFLFKIIFIHLKFMKAMRYTKS